MKVVIQRVTEATLKIGGRERCRIGRGLVALFAAGEGDTLDKAPLLATKTANLRVFSDSEDKMNISALELGLAIMAVPNFTLFADTKKGRRPSFINSGSPQFANEAFELYKKSLLLAGIKSVASGEFGADMQLSLTNDGPVTIIMDTREWEA